MSKRERHRDRQEALAIQDRQEDEPTLPQRD